jgi:hypothetical protein
VTTVGKHENQAIEVILVRGITAEMKALNYYFEASRLLAFAPLALRMKRPKHLQEPPPCVQWQLAKLPFTRNMRSIYELQFCKLAEIQIFGASVNYGAVF